MKLGIRRIAMISLVSVLILTINLKVSVAQEMKTDIDLPSVSLYADGRYTPDVNTLSSNFGVPTEILHSANPSYYHEVVNQELLDRGFRSVYFDQDSQKWKVEFTTKIDAPLLDADSYISNMLSDGNEDNDPSIDMSDTEDNLRADPDRTARTNKDQGLPFWYGDLSYQLENDTDDSGTSWNYTTDFLVDNYKILFLDQIGDYSASNLSVVVSYVEDLSYVNLNSSYAYNLTIFNEPVDGYDDLWFRLDLENANSTHDAYVANIELKNFDVRGGRYIVDPEVETIDQRYQENFIGSLDDVIEVTSNTRAADYFKKKIDGPLATHNMGADQGLKLSGWLDDVTNEDVLSVSSDFDTNEDDMVSEIRGWEDAESLENDIKRAIVDKSDEDKITSIDMVDDLELSNAIMNWDIPAKTVDKISKALDKAADKTSTIKDAIAMTAKDTLKKIMVVSDEISNKLSTNGFFSDLGSGVSSVIDSTGSAVGSVLGGAGSFGSNIIGSVTDGGSNLIDSGSNLANTTFHGVSSGAATIMGGAGQLASDVGLNFTPIIIGAVVVAGIIALMYVRTMMNAQNM